MKFRSRAKFLQAFCTALPHPRARGVRGGCAENLAIWGQLFALRRGKETIMTNGILSTDANVNRKFAEKNCFSRESNPEPKAKRLVHYGLTT